MADLLSDADIGIAPPVKGGAKGNLLSDEDIGLGKPVAIGSGQEQAAADEALVAKERGYIPDEVKAFTRSAADTALIGAPTHAMALARSYSENLPYKEALAKERAYKEALERQSPKASMAGTGAGIAGSLLVPAGPIGTLGMKAAQMAGRAGLGSTGKAAVSGATIGAGFGGLSGVSEKYGTEEFTPEGIAKSAGLGAAGGALIGPIAEKVLGKTVAPEHAAKAAILESQGIKPSQQMVTGIAAPEGAATKTAEEMTAKAKEILEQKRQSLLTPDVSPEAGAEALQAAGKSKFEAAQAPYKAIDQMKGVVNFGDSATEYIAPIVEQRIASAKVNPNYANLPENYPATNAAKRILNVHLQDFDARDVGPTLAEVMQVKSELGKVYRMARNTDDSKALQAVIDGYKDAVNKSVIDGLFTGNAAEASAKLAMADKGWAQYMRDFNPKKGAESSIFKGILNKMVDSDTGYLAQKLTPDMAQAAQGMIDSKIIDPKFGPALYSRLQRTIGADTPAMNNFNSLIKNQMLTPKNGDMSLLPKQIVKYTDPASLPVTLQAFGAKGGNLKSLAAHASDSAETAAAKKQLLDLQNMGKAIEIINARPVSDDAKKSLIGALIKKYGLSLAGAAIGHPSGAAEAVLGALAGKAVGETGSRVGSVFESAAQRAGAPKTVLPEGQGFIVPNVGRVFPVIKDLEEVAPPDREPGYQMPQPLARKSGGRVSDQLVRAVDRAKKNINKDTEVLLNTPDSHVAHALEVANRNLEG